MFRNSNGWVGFVFAALITQQAVAGEPDETFRKSVEADWARQERRLGRVLNDPAAIHAALDRGERLLADLAEMPDGPNVSRETEALRDIRERVRAGMPDTAEERTAVYNELRWLTRGAAFKNPLVESSEIAFMKRRRFICQMLHEYMGYYYDYGDISGGGVYVLETPGTSPNARDLLQGRLPDGNFVTLAPSYDARTLYFAFADRAPGKTDYHSSERRVFHIYAVDPDGNNLRQLTYGPDDDFDPCALPDGGLAFMSTRRGGYIRCSGPWEPLSSYTLHRMNADGSDIQTLSFHETDEWHPSVLMNGTIVYARWDYVDRSAAHFHGLWTSNPDGTDARALFGSYTQKINACFQPRGVPGSNKIVFVAGAHHADVGGSLVLLDPDRVALDKETAQDDFRSLDVLTPEVCFPEAPGWPDSYFHSPWPLSENYYLVSFSFDPLPGMGPKIDEDTATGIYLMDRFGNLELLYREEGISCMYPIPLKARHVPPVISGTFDQDLGQEGELMLSNVYESHLPLPAGRRVETLRVFQILPKSETHIANKPRIGYANAESARMLLGTVPVEADGSAYFRAPARKPLAFQAVDEDGRAVQGMRSLTYLQPGERQGCVGCHESPGTTAAPGTPIAMRRAPSKIEPGPDGSMPWSFQRLVQPILDKHCVGCHDGSGGEEEGPCDLTNKVTGDFTAAYDNLRPYVRWYEWGKMTINKIVTRPAQMPSDLSPLTAVLEGPNHSKRVQLSDEEFRRLYLWLDGNASFYGTYTQEKRSAQKKGEVVLAPVLH